MHPKARWTDDILAVGAGRLEEHSLVPELQKSTRQARFAIQQPHQLRLQGVLRHLSKLRLHHSLLLLAHAFLDSAGSAIGCHDRLLEELEAGRPTRTAASRWERLLEHASCSRAAISLHSIHRIPCIMPSLVLPKAW